MTDRDDLIELLTDADMQRDDWDKSTYEAQADALLAAGWREPTGRVWVVTEDSYGLTSVVGVYRTAELAKAAVEKDRTTPVEYMSGHMGRSHRVFEVDEHDVHDDDALDD